MNSRWRHENVKFENRLHEFWKHLSLPKFLSKSHELIVFLNGKYASLLKFDCKFFQQSYYICYSLASSDISLGQYTEKCRATISLINRHETRNPNKRHKENMTTIRLFRRRFLSKSQLLYYFYMVYGYVFGACWPHWSLSDRIVLVASERCTERALIPSVLWVKV